MTSKNIINKVVKATLLSLSLFMSMSCMSYVHAEEPAEDKINENTATLLKNGDFSNTTTTSGKWTGEAAENWQVWIDSKYQSNTSYTLEVKDQELYIQSNEKFRAAIHQTIQDIDPAKKYRLSYKIKVDQKTGYVRARIQERNAVDGKFSSARNLFSQEVHGTHDWQEIIFEYIPDTDVTAVKIELFYEAGTGSAWFDDVKFEEYTETKPDIPEENPDPNNPEIEPQPQDPQSQSPESLLINSQFHDIKDGQAPWSGKAATSWNAWTPNNYKDVSEAQIYINEQHELVISSPVEYRACVYQDLTNFDNTKTYRLKVLAKTDHKDGLAKVRILEKRKDNNKYETVNTVSSNTITGTTADWQELIIDYTPLHLTQEIRVELFFEKGTGTVIFQSAELIATGIREPFAPKDVNRELEKEITLPLDKIYTFKNSAYTYTAADDLISVADGMIIPKKTGESSVTVSENNQNIATVPIHIIDKVGDEYDALLDKWNEIIVGNSVFDADNQAMKDLFESLEANSKKYISEIKNEKDRQYLWEDANDFERSKSLTTSFRRLEEIAKQITNPKSQYYQDPQAIRLVRESLEWLCTNVYNSKARVIGNWWDYEIGTPRAINNTLSLMHPYFSNEEIKLYTEGIEYFVPDPTRFRVIPNDPFEALGGNLVDMGRVKIISGLLRKDDQEVEAAVNAMHKVFVIVDNGQGFYQDGSYIDHTNVAYTGAYGNVLIDGFSQLLPIIQASKSKLPNEKILVIQHWIDQAFLPLIVHNELMDMSRGRSISRSSTEDHVASVEVLRGIIRTFDIFDNAYKQKLKEEIKTILMEDSFYNVNNNLKSYGDIAAVKKLLEDPSVRTVQRPTKLSLFNHMDKVAYYNAEKDFGFAISMHSGRTLNFEMMNSENRHAWYTADGMTYLYNGDLAHYSNHYWPTVDPYYLSGTTVADDEKRADGETGEIMSSTFVGGIKASESYGTVAMDFESQKKSVKVHKAWFICDDQIISVGSAVSKPESHTTVDQRKLEAGKEYKFYIDGNQIDLTSDIKTYSNVTSIFVETDDVKRNIGYHFLTPASVEISLNEQSGTWFGIRAVDGESKETVKNTFFKIVLSHKDVDNYAYACIPNVSKDAFMKIIADDHIQLIYNNENTQAVYDKRNNSYGIVKYQDTSEKFGDTTVDKKGIYSLIAGNGNYYQPMNMAAEQIGNPAADTTVQYSVLENELDGKNGIYRIRVDIPFEKFTAVKVDGVELSSDLYDAEEGSTIIRLKPNYIQTLHSGEHVIQILAEDGQISQKFTVNRQYVGSSVVKTADDHSVLMYAMWMIAAVVICVFVQMKRSLSA